MKKFWAMVAGLISPFIFVAPAFAATTINICPSSIQGSSDFSRLCQFNIDSFPSLVSAIINILLIVAVIIALVFLIYGGIRWILSGGDKTAVESARNHIIAAIIGLVIVLLAFFIINLIGGLFGININKLTLPQLPTQSQ